MVPALVVCILPIGLLQWVALLYGLGNSTLFVVMSLRGRGEVGRQVGVWTATAAVSLVLLLCVKLIFLVEPAAVPANNTTPPNTQ